MELKKKTLFPLQDPNLFTLFNIYNNKISLPVSIITVIMGPVC